MKIYVSTIIENDGKYLFVQENKKSCYGKWNFPGGHVEDDEYIVYAARREVKEETNVDVDISNLVNIYNNMFNGVFSVLYVFSGKMKNNTNVSYDSNEIVNCMWFSYKEIEAMKDNLRDSDFILNSLKNYENGKLYSLECIIMR